MTPFSKFVMYVDVSIEVISSKDFVCKSSMRGAKEAFKTSSPSAELLVTPSAA